MFTRRVDEVRALSFEDIFHPPSLVVVQILRLFHVFNLHERRRSACVNHGIVSMRGTPIPVLRNPTVC